MRDRDNNIYSDERTNECGGRTDSPTARKHNGFGDTRGDEGSGVNLAAILGARRLDPEGSVAASGEVGMGSGYAPS